jgi:hypothetical protein
MLHFSCRSHPGSRVQSRPEQPWQPLQFGTSSELGGLSQGCTNPGLQLHGRLKFVQ